MSIYVTNAPEAYDYSGTVLSSEVLTAHFSERMGLRNGPRPFRRIELDDRERGYYRDYQIGRYYSGMYLVMTQEKYEQEVRDGYIEE
jgi:hypothetical protein